MVTLQRRFQLPETSNPISFGEITSTKWSSHFDGGGDRSDEKIQSDGAYCDKIHRSMKTRGADDYGDDDDDDEECDNDKFHKRGR